MTTSHSVIKRVTSEANYSGGVGRHTRVGDRGGSTVLGHVTVEKLNLPVPNSSATSAMGKGPAAHPVRPSGDIGQASARDIYTLPMLTDPRLALADSVQFPTSPRWLAPGGIRPI